jgi:hypothetical protein
MKIFISYTTRDHYIDRELLVRASKVVSNYGSHYIDLLHNNSFNKQLYVELMLSQANFLVLLESKSIRTSEWVQWELREAELKGIPVIRIPATSDQEQTIRNLKFELASELKKLTKFASKGALTRAA